VGNFGLRFHNLAEYDVWQNNFFFLPKGRTWQAERMEVNAKINSALMNIEFAPHLFQLLICILIIIRHCVNDGDEKCR